MIALSCFIFIVPDPISPDFLFFCPSFSCLKTLLFRLSILYANFLMLLPLIIRMQRYFTVRTFPKSHNW